MGTTREKRQRHDSYFFIGLYTLVSTLDTEWLISETKYIMQEVEPKVEGVGLMRERECNCGILRYYI